jgi:hypothetical protein
MGLESVILQKIYESLEKLTESNDSLHAFLSKQFDLLQENLTPDNDITDKSNWLSVIGKNIKNSEIQHHKKLAKVYDKVFKISTLSAEIKTLKNAILDNAGIKPENNLIKKTSLYEKKEKPIETKINDGGIFDKLLKLLPLLLPIISGMMNSSVPPWQGSLNTLARLAALPTKGLNFGILFDKMKKLIMTPKEIMVNFFNKTKQWIDDAYKLLFGKNLFSVNVKPPPLPTLLPAIAKTPTIGGVVGSFLKGLIRSPLKLLSKLPVIGTLLSLYFAYDRFSKGDIKGGLIEILAGLAANVPYVGTAISIGLGLFNAWRDATGETKKDIQDNKSGEGIFGYIYKFFENFGDNVYNFPVIGDAVRAYDHFKANKWKEGFISLAGAIPAFGALLSFVTPETETRGNNAGKIRTYNKINWADAAKYIKSMLYELPHIGPILWALDAIDSGKKEGIMGLLPQWVTKLSSSIGGNETTARAFGFLPSQISPSPSTQNASNSTKNNETPVTKSISKPSSTPSKVPESKPELKDRREKTDIEDVTNVLQRGFRSDSEMMKIQNMLLERNNQLLSHISKNYNSNNALTQPYIIDNSGASRIDQYSDTKRNYISSTQKIQ